MPRPGRHPLDVARAQAAAIAEAVPMVHRPGEHVRDGFDAAVRVPREPGQVVARHVVAEVVEQQEGIVLVGVAKAERAAQAHAGAFDGGLGFDDALDRADGHRGSFDHYPRSGACLSGSPTWSSSRAWDWAASTRTWSSVSRLFSLTRALGLRVLSTIVSREAVSFAVIPGLRGLMRTAGAA